MENRRPITYTFEDIKRYKQGLMNREEMHAFEKASMEDPFLSDALEGYMEADIALTEQHHNNIKDRIAGIEEKKEKAVVVAMPQKRFGFMRVAAMIVVIAGAGLLTYKIFDKKQPVQGTDPLAKVETPVNEIKPGDNGKAAAPSTNISEPSSKGNIEGTEKNISNYQANKDNVLNKDITPDNKALANAETEKQKSADIIRREVIQNNTDKEASVKPPKPVLAEVAEVKEDNVAVTNSNAVKHKSAPATNNQFNGKVVTTNNQPLANAYIRLDNSGRKVSTDDMGNFSIAARDSVVVATIETPGYMNNRVELKSNASNTINLGSITLQPDPSLNEIAVTGLGTAKKQQRVVDTLVSKPEGGWESFQHYVAGKLNREVDTTGNDIKTIGGELELEFFVDANGLPKNIKVLNSTDPALNDKAIEALKLGPKWATRKKKARILIRY